jgi:hypothetical protein
MRTRLYTMVSRVGVVLLGVAVLATAVIVISSAAAAPPAQERLFDASYREANRVAGGRGYDWTDTFYWGGVGLAVAAISGVMLAVWWTSDHRRSRQPRGTALPTH